MVAEERAHVEELSTFVPSLFHIFVQATPHRLLASPRLELAEPAGWALSAGIGGFEREVIYLFEKHNQKEYVKQRWKN